jgi:outer membrane protein
MTRALLFAVAVAALAASVALAQELPDRPLTLEDCMIVALANSPDIFASQQAIISARAGLTSTRSSYYPQLSLSAVEGLTSSTSSIWVDGSRVSVPGEDTRQDMDLTLRATLWRLGRAESVAEREALLRAVEFNHVAAVQSLLEQVARSYYGLLAAGELVGVSQAGVTSAQGHVDEVRARAALGDVAEADVLPVEYDLARAELDVIDARAGVRLALAQLRNTLALPTETEFAVAQAPPPSQPQLASLQECLATGLAARPEVSAGEQYLRADRYALRQARIRRGPSVEVGGQYNRGYTDWEARDPSWNLLLSLSWPLFDGHAAEANETSARSSLARAEADLDRLAQQVALDIEGALIEVERAWDHLDATVKAVAVADARLAAAEARYPGTGTLLEVIDARVAVTEARAGQVRAGYDHHVALVALQRALGALSAPEAQP